MYLHRYSVSIEMIHYLFSNVNPYVTILVREIENKNRDNNIEGGDSMNQLHTINAEDLQNRTYEPTHFLIDKLIPEGLHILAGAPKLGKSWLALLMRCAGAAALEFRNNTGRGSVSRPRRFVSAYPDMALCPDGRCAVDAAFCDHG